MTNNSLNKQPECICYCTGTTREKIEILIADGVNTLEGIAYETGATTGCGACDYLVMELLVQGEQKNRG
ncbi:MAG: (2Fe-2S)-binding protein [Methylococcales bacterium]|nr:(2Fe-2S)-binding protein [Methylococcales bacterium]MDP3010324.1 (2Fe-2S)-binding protein [Methylococcales bacterium]MDP3838024.1 (2Fe-2S)-binding protein [Methylococcales bacterium]